MMFIAILLLTMFILLVYYYYVHYGRNGRLLNLVSGPPGVSIVGNAIQFNVSAKEIWEQFFSIADKYYPIYKICGLFMYLVSIRYPDDLETILSSTKHIEKGIMYKFLHPWLGKGLLTSTGSYVIPGGTSLFLNIYGDPNFWSNPEVFDPDRFLPERIQNRHPYSYLPFSAGPRNCIGQRFGLLELKAMIAPLVHNFYLEPIDHLKDIRLRADIIIRPSHPVHIKFIPIIRK